MKKFVLVLTVLILSLGFFGCDNGTNGGGSGNWGDMVGAWLWVPSSSSSYYITLTFSPDKSMNIGWTGGIMYDAPFGSGGGSIAWLKYDGNKLIKFDYDGTLEHEWTVTFNDDKDELTFSNYKKYPAGSVHDEYAYMVGKTFIKQP